MNKIKFIAGLHLVTMAFTAIYMARQERDNKEQEELLILGNDIIKHSTEGTKVVGNWHRDGKITREMASEFIDACTPDKETTEKIMKL